MSGSNLLGEALSILGWQAGAEPIHDEYGVMGYRVNDFILVAKKKPYGEIVSCHKSLMWIAIKEGKKILFYIGASGNFYKFSPNEIHEKVFMWHEGFINYRKARGKPRVEMVNFSIRLGKRFSLLPEEQLTLF